MFDGRAISSALQAFSIFLLLCGCLVLKVTFVFCYGSCWVCGCCVVGNLRFLWFLLGVWVLYFRQPSFYAMVVVRSVSA